MKAKKLLQHSAAVFCCCSCVVRGKPNGMGDGDAGKVSVAENSLEIRSPNLESKNIQQSLSENREFMMKLNGVVSIG